MFALWNTIIFWTDCLMLIRGGGNYFCFVSLSRQLDKSGKSKFKLRYVLNLHNFAIILIHSDTGGSNTNSRLSQISSSQDKRKFKIETVWFVRTKNCQLLCVENLSKSSHLWANWTSMDLHEQQGKIYQTLETNIYCVVSRATNPVPQEKNMVFERRPFLWWIIWCFEKGKDLI